MPRKSGKKTKSKKDRTRNDKGILLEQVVAMLHKEEGVKVETNVFLTPKSGDETRKREIDVLLTRDVAGYPVRVAIQCKNYGKPITIGQIGEFRDLLEDVGIPFQYGIIVSINGYQAGAESRAKELGIKTFVLEGLDATRLKVEIHDTFQFFVHLLLVVEQMNIESKISNGYYVFQFWDENNEFCGLLSDLIVSHWRNGQIPSKLGEYKIDLQLPQGWLQRFNNEVSTPISMSAKVRVVAYLAEMKGKIEEYKLKETETNIIEKFHIKADFDVLNNLIRSSRQEPILTEEELKEIKKNSKISIENRIRLPKIFVFNHLEPMSEKTLRFFIKETENLTIEEIEKLPKPKFEEIEGNIFVGMQEPTAFGEPVIIPNDSGELIDVRLLTKQGKFGDIVELFPLLQKFPRDDFSEYLSIAFLSHSETLLEKSKKEIEFKRIFERQAFTMLDRAIQLSPNHIEMCLSVGITLGKYKFYDKAIQCFNKVIASQPQNKEARYYLAHTHFNMGNVDESVNVIKETAKKIEDLPSRMILLAVKIDFMDGQYEEASIGLRYVWEKDSKAMIENEFWHPLIVDIYQKNRVIGNAFILCDMDLFYVCKYAKSEVVEKSKKHLEFAVKTLEEIYQVMGKIIDEAVINTFNSLLSKANEIVDEVNSLYATDLWKDRLNLINY